MLLFMIGSALFMYGVVAIIPLGLALIGGTGVRIACGVALLIWTLVYIGGVCNFIKEVKEDND